MRKLASDSLVYGLGSVANQALSLLLLPPYAHCLTPADYASLALIGAAGKILAIMAALGIHSGLVRIFFSSFGSAQRRAVVLSALVFGVAAALAKALLRVAEMKPEARRAIGDAARASVEAPHQMWVVAARHLDLYGALLFRDEVRGRIARQGERRA